MAELNSAGALQAALGYLARGSKSMAQVRQYLEKKGFQDGEIHAAMNRLLAYGFVDDQAYARRFIATHPSNGQLLLRQKLRQRGIDQDTAQDALSDVPEEEQVAQALEVLKKKLKGQRDRDAVRKAMQAALRRGFPYAIVRSAAARYDEEAVEDLYDQ